MADKMLEIPRPGVSVGKCFQKNKNIIVFTKNVPWIKDDLEFLVNYHKNPFLNYI